MVVCTGDARQLRVNISMHSRSFLARAPVRNSLNLALPSGMRTCSQFTEYESLPPPPKKNISHRIYTIHVGHLFWFQNGEFRGKVRDFHACFILYMLPHGSVIKRHTINYRMQMTPSTIFL